MLTLMTQVTWKLNMPYRFPIITRRAVMLASFLLLGFSSRLCFGQANILTFHNDGSRTGQNLLETTLKHSNVNSASFGRLFTLGVDGKVDAQPLYVSGMSVPGHGFRDVVFAATEHDSVYAFDAENGSVYWHISLLGAGETPSDSRDCGQVIPEIGITSTPVIDRNSGPSGTIYLVAMSKDGSGNYHQRLHALNLVTGAEEFNGPVDIQASVPGSGENSANGTVTFDPKQYKERAALLLSNGVVYTSWTSHCDHQPYTGWTIGYDERTLAKRSTLNFAPNGGEASIWNAGNGPAVDANGNLYFELANGTFDSTLNAQGFPKWGDYGNAFVKVQPFSGGLQVTDYWTMSNTRSESAADVDLGSGGLMLLPDVQDQDGNVRHLGTGAGKDGNVYVFDRDNMGKFDPNSNGTLYQELLHGLGGSEYASPAWFNGAVYYGGVRDVIRAFKVNSGRLANVPDSQTQNTFGYPGATPAISANGTADPILWAVENGDSAVLHAYDADNLATELYNSNQAAGGRDQFGPGNKYITPAIANGKVYVGTTNSVAVFGVLNPSPIADGEHTLTNAASNLVLDNPAFSTNSGQQIIQWSSNGGANQAWRFSWQGNGYYTIQNVWSGLYLTNASPAGSTNGLLQQYPAQGGDSQLWSITATEGFYVITSKVGGLAIDDPASSPNSGTGLILWPANNGVNQSWSIN